MITTSPFERHEFADLYALLNAPPNAPAEVLSERINALYLEAQRNLDHHNFRKRFYYQQLFEVHLPQAHAWLLAPDKRAYYDACLNAWQQEREFPVAPVFAPISTTPDNASRTFASAPGDTDFLPSTVSPARSTRPAATSPAATATPPRAATSTAWSPAMPNADEFAAMAQLASDALSALSPSLARPAPRGVTGPVLHPREVEQRRDHKRRALIERELREAARLWSVIGAIAAAGPLVLGAALLARARPHAAWGIWIAGILLASVAAWLCAKAASRAKRRSLVAHLSKMPYEQLLRRCGS